MVEKRSVQTMNTDIIVSKVPIWAGQESVQLFKSRLAMIIRPSKQSVFQFQFNQIMLIDDSIEKKAPFVSSSRFIFSSEFLLMLKSPPISKGN
jgi:hypothetical protein